MLEMFSELKYRAGALLQEHGKWLLLAIGVVFALLALANFNAAMTIAIVLAAVTYGLGWWRLDE